MLSKILQWDFLFTSNQFLTCPLNWPFYPPFKFYNPKHFWCNSDFIIWVVSDFIILVVYFKTIWDLEGYEVQVEMAHPTPIIHTKLTITATKIFVYLVYERPRVISWQKKEENERMWVEMRNCGEWVDI